MSQTSIEWTATTNADGTTTKGHTWNPVTGCTRASEGCDYCYAVRMTKRLELMGKAKYVGLVNPGKQHFNGVVNCHEAELATPLRKTKPVTWFVNSMSDLFHEAVPYAFIDKVFAVMAMCPKHTFIVLTKRAERMAAYFAAGEEALMDRWADAACEPTTGNSPCAAGLVGEADWPLANVVLGVSVENQEQANKRIPPLLRVPAAVRVLSCEPLLGPIDLTRWMPPGQVRASCAICGYFTAQEPGCKGYCQGKPCDGLVCPGCSRKHCWTGSHPGNGRKNNQPLGWVIVGGESGSEARPMKPKWVRQLRDQCAAAEVPFFFKQWGTYEPYRQDVQRPFWEDTKGQLHDGHVLRFLDDETGDLDPKRWHPMGEYSKTQYRKVGKDKAGRVLDGREHSDKPILSTSDGR